jgi:phage tail tape-measure protein
MSTYFGNDNSSYLHPDDQSYSPYVDNGPYAKSLKETGQLVGAAALGTVGGLAGAPTGPGIVAGAVIGTLIGNSIGGSAGEAAGFYIDNMSSMIDNMNAFFNELNDPNSLAPTSPFGM